MDIRYRSSTGSPLISVTQVLGLAGLVDDRWYTPESAERGKDVHELTVIFDKKDRPLHIGPGLHGYIDAYADFVATVKPTFIAAELQVQRDDATLRLAGTIDRVCSQIFGHPGHVDLKTGDPEPWHGLQLAGYNLLKPQGSRWCVYLGSNGRFRVKQYGEASDYGRFMDAYHRAVKIVKWDAGL